jgi:YVTN family beta-propeller protein
MSRGRVFYAAMAVAAVALGAFASSALARNLYVANYNSDTVSVIDGTTNQIVGTIDNGVNTGPWTLAITPDGKTVYVTNYDSGGIDTIDTATNQIVGAPIATPTGAWGMAISPDGTRGYFATEEKLFTVDLQARQLVGTPVEVCPATDVIVTPDGARAYVVCSEEVVVVDLASNAVVGGPIPVESAYLGSISPDGMFVYLGNYEGGSVTVIETATNQTSPIVTGGHPESVAVSPDGTRAYVSDEEGEGIITIDTATRQVIGSLFPLSIEAEYIAVSPDGRKLFTNSEGQDAVAGIDLSTNQKIGPLLTGDGAGPLAFIPDQSPTASFASTAKVRPGVPATLSGAASSDPDGTVSTFAWQFGDGGTATEPSSTATHTYANPGSYPVTLTVTDNEGCSVAMTYTGHTASCHGSPAAAVTQAVEVKYPGVKVKCPKKAGAKGCVFKLKAVQKKGKGKKQKLTAQSAVAKVKVKAGKSAIVSLKPKSKFAQKLATAAKALVEQTVTKNGKTTTKVSKLKIVE